MRAARGRTGGIVALAALAASVLFAVPVAAETVETAESGGAGSKPDATSATVDPRPGTGPGAGDPASSSAEPAGPATAVDVIGGRFDWGVKETFRKYVTGPIARGSVSTSGGATVNSDGTFRFPATGGTYDHASRTASVAFAGAVHFRGHGYHDPQAGDLLQLSLSELRLEVAGDRAELVADVLSLALEGDIGNPQPGGQPVLYDDVVVVDLDLAGTGPVKDGTNGLAWTDVPTVLATGGAPAFEDFYPAGTPFDPASFVFEVADVPDDVPDAPPPPPAPSASLDTAVVRAGDPLTVRGNGFLPGEQVEVWLLPDLGWVSTAVADGSGDLVHTFVMPVTTAPGPHEVELRGISSGLTLRSPVVEVLPAAVAIAAPPAATTGGPLLPATGQQDLVLALVALALIAVGSGLVLVERRHRAGQAGAS